MPRNPLAPQSNKKRSAQSVILGLCLLLSAALHIPFLLIPSSWIFSNKPLPQSKRTIVVQRLYSNTKKRSRYRKLRNRSAKKLRTITRQKEKRKVPPKPEKLKGQVVDLAPTPDSRRPKNAKYLSEHNTNTKKETVSRHQRLKYRLAMKRLMRKRRARPKKARLVARGMSSQSRTALQRSQKPGPRKPGQKPSPINIRKATPRKPRLAIPKLKRKKRLKLALSPKNARLRYQKRSQRALPGKGRVFSLGIGKLTIDLSMKKNDKSAGGQEGKPTPSSGVPNVIDLRPDFGTLSRIQGAPAPDKIDAPLGEETALNSRRWLYASFFNRVKQLIAQHWNPVRLYQSRDPYMNVYGVRDRTTTLRVILRPDGTLKHLVVASSCGLSFLDREAMRSIRAAQPFPNPPKALIQNGKISFNFGFTLNLSNRQNIFQIFRR